MAFKFNPFTGTFDYINKSTGGEFSPYIRQFQANEWENLGNNIYKLNVVHNKNTIAPEVVIYELGQEILPEKIEVVSSNMIDIFVRDEPFSGVIKVI